MRITGKLTHAAPARAGIAPLAALALAAWALCPLSAADAGAGPTPEEARQFIADANARLKELGIEGSAAHWVNETYETDETNALSAHMDDELLAWLGQAIRDARRFDGVPMDADTARQFLLLKLAAPFLPPQDPARRAEMTRIAASMQAMYASAKYCPADGECMHLEDLRKVLADPANFNADGYARLLDAWRGWHDQARPMRADYAKFVELANEGARDFGYANVAELWQSGYDMKAPEFSRDTERLWQQVKPLYAELQCYVRERLARVYGRDRMGADGTIPAHLLGNMWAQEWNNLYPLVEPYPGARGADIDAVLKQRYDALEQRLRAAAAPDAVAQADAIHDAQVKMAAQMVGAAGDGAPMSGSAESFYQSLGMLPLPATFWERSQFFRPRDRDVQCHASAWHIDADQDVRLKVCLSPTAEDLYTAYHELGHIHYFLAYRQLPYLFEQGANDGFHEAIGDTVRLAITPGYLHQVGLAPEPQESPEATLNHQMQVALDKVAFLPFGKMIDEWRWKVFSGEIAPSDYNAAWWRLRREYQGVSAPIARDETDFDPGAKNHIAANVPYMRYFLADIYQFQFYRALCKAAGHTGPLYDCTFFNSREAGAKFERMLALGASRPWQDAMYELTGSRAADASAIIEYFAPLQNWLKKQNRGRSCGWK